MTAARAARLLVHLAAVIAPGHRRADLTEQWLADLAGTAELGLSPLSVATGALRTSVSPSIWRTPALSGAALAADPEAVPAVRTIGWRLAGVQAGALLTGLLLSSIGVLLPYVANGVHRLPRDVVMTSSYDVAEWWPRAGGDWLWLLGVLGLVVLTLSAFAVPVICLEALISLRTGHASTGGRTGPVVGLVVVAACALGLLAFFTTPTWEALIRWFFD